MISENTEKEFMKAIDTIRSEATIIKWAAETILKAHEKGLKIDEEFMENSLENIKEESVRVGCLNNFLDDIVVSGNRVGKLMISWINKG